MATLIVPELMESVSIATHVSVFYSTNFVGHLVHRFPNECPVALSGKFAVELHNINGHTLTVFVHNNLLYVNVVTVAASILAAVTVSALTLEMFTLPRTSL